VFTKESLAGIIQHFALLEGKKSDPLAKKTLIFPRYHQLDVVRKLLSRTAQSGVGHSYLIQHSAGSGKSNSITWSAYQLIESYPETKKAASEHDLDQPFFDSVIVVTDRRLLDKQLRENRITLDDLPTLPVGEIAALPGDQLALLKQDADERLRAAKNLCDWLDGAIALKYGDQAQEVRRAEGNVRATSHPSLSKGTSRKNTSQSVVRSLRSRHEPAQLSSPVVFPRDRPHRYSDRGGGTSEPVALGALGSDPHAGGAAGPCAL
jgi:hypothetical protein